MRKETEIMRWKSITPLLVLAWVVPWLTSMNAGAAELVVKKEPVVIRNMKTEVVRTADNFIFIYDASSTMTSSYEGTEMTKIAAEHRILEESINKLPELNWKAGLYSFEVVAGKLETSLHPYYDMKPYNKEAFEAAIDQLPTQGIGPPLLQRALEELEPILVGLSGRTVVYIVTDGTYTRTGDIRTPTQIARELARKYNVCFYVLSHAVGAAEKQILESVASINECSRVIPFDSLLYRPETLTGALYVVENQVIAHQENREKVVGLDVNDILFDFNKMDIKPAFHSELDELGQFLQSHPKAYVILEGFTDGTGSDEYNLELSRRRAESVGKYLMDNFNIDEGRIVKHWYGTSYPVASNATSEGRARNRRVVGIIAGME